MDCSRPGFPVLHHLPELVEIHVHWVGDAIWSSVIPFSSCLQSFAASGSFPVSLLFASGGQSIGASVLVLPMNIEGWFPLGLTCLIFLPSKDSQVFSSPTVQRHKLPPISYTTDFLKNKWFYDKYLHKGFILELWRGSPGYILRGEVAALSEYICKYYQKTSSHCFSKNDSSLHSHQQYTEFLFSPTCSQTLGVICLFNFCQLDECILISHCNFNFNFSEY